MYLYLYVVLNSVLLCDFGDLRGDFCLEFDLIVVCDWGFLYAKVLVSCWSDCSGVTVGLIGEVW